MWRIIGHEWVVALLQQAIAAERIAHAYLVTGPAHIGKTLLAMDLAAALNCTGSEPPCGLCPACIRTMQGSHPDAIVVEPVSGHIKIDQVRQLQRELALSPYLGRCKICIVADFHQATAEAANALLKTLEEPPETAHLVLTATDATLLLPTIVSRCQVLALRPLSAARIEQALVERCQVAESSARILARLSAGRIGWAIHVAQDPALLEQRQGDLRELLGVLDQGRAAKVLYAEKVAGRQDLRDLLHLWQTWWRDVMLIRGGCEELIVNLDRRDALHNLAGRYTLAQISRALTGIQASGQQIEQNVNPRLSLEVLFLSWP